MSPRAALLVFGLLGVLASPAMAAPQLPEPLERPELVKALEARAVECLARHRAELSGTLVVRLELERNGRPLEARMDSRDFEAPELVECLLTVLADPDLTWHPPGPRHIDFLRLRLDTAAGSPVRLDRISTLSGRKAGLKVSPADQVDHVLHGAAEQLDACNPQRGPDPDRATPLYARFVVDHRGEVWWASVEGPEDRRRVAECLEATLYALHFSSPRGYRFAEVRYSLLLPPRGGVELSAFGPKVDLRRLPGALSRSAVDRIVDPEFRTVRSCYDRARELDPDLGGRLWIDFLVETHGGADFVRVSAPEGPLGDRGAEAFLSECVGAVFDSLEFPKPRYGGVVRIRYPLRFEPSVRTSRRPGR